MKNGIRIVGAMSLVGLLLFSGCTGLQQPSHDTNMEPNLARTPIGVHVQKAHYYAGTKTTYADITVRNNSGAFIGGLYIEILVYNGDIRVGRGNHIFNSVNAGETMITQNPILSGGRSWNKWKATYKILK